jgi:signal transduction histidine kinase
MRTLLLELRPAALVEASLDDLLRQLAEAATGQGGFPVTVEAEGGCVLPSDVHVALYRIVQESLNNAVKHARASQVAIYLRCTSSQVDGREPGTAELRVCDDGRGFDPGRIPAERLGLSIMQERAEAVGARLKVESQPGRGTEVRVIWSDEGVS